MITNTRTLVTFLGKAIRDKVRGYRTANYKFADSTIDTTPFFGLALRKKLDLQNMLILGTSGSMWDVLVEHLAIEGEDEGLRIELMTAAESSTVSQDLLDRATPLISHALAVPCILRLIPYGKNSEEQTLILDAIAQSVPPGKVVVDLTHGFRHLAAIGLLSAFFLEQIQGLTVEALYYGALEMTEHGNTPVLNLDGMMAIQNWINAVERFDQNGDYSVFVPLLEIDGVPTDKLNCLREAAHFERTFNLSLAHPKLQTFLIVLDQPLNGVSRLFQDQLNKRLSWARRGGLLDHQKHLAHFYLDSGDYVRAVIFGYEAMITQQCNKLGYPPYDYEKREAALETFRSAIKNDESYGKLEMQAYEMLRIIRNTIAHGNRAKQKKYRDIIMDREKLHQELKQAMNALNI